MSATYTPHPDVVFRRLEGRLVLVHMATNQVFELNRTGARIWELLVQGIGGEQLVQSLAHEFDVDREQLRSEVSDILSDLVAENLITEI
jgi:hypothetical protein